MWTGSEMIVWGGQTNKGAYSNAGAKYIPSTDHRGRIKTTGAPSARRFHTGVWTGTEMIVWGGYNNSEGTLNSGGRYSP